VLVLLVAWPHGAIAADKNKSTIQIRALSYESQVSVHKSSYFAPGRSSTNCNGMGTTIGNTTTATANCQTTSTPPQTHVINSRRVDVTNFVEADGQRYTITCTAGWVGSNCAPLIAGDVFPAWIEGNTMWIYAHKGGNQGRLVKE